ncbi:hypothetical protein BHE74_00023423, partial [Ensete ventricosum]
MYHSRTPIITAGELEAEEGRGRREAVVWSRSTDKEGSWRLVSISLMELLAILEGRGGVGRRRRMLRGVPSNVY